MRQQSNKKHTGLGEVSCSSSTWYITKTPSLEGWPGGACLKQPEFVKKGHWNLVKPLHNAFWQLTMYHSLALTVKKVCLQQPGKPVCVNDPVLTMGRGRVCRPASCTAQSRSDHPTGTAARPRQAAACSSSNEQQHATKATLSSGIGVASRDGWLKAANPSLVSPGPLLGWLVG